VAMAAGGRRGRGWRKGSREQVGFLSLFVTARTGLDKQLSNRVDPVPGKASFLFCYMSLSRVGTEFYFGKDSGPDRGGTL
jgi:hypothetical protein